MAGNIHAQESLPSVQRDMDRVEKEIEREKDLHKTERKRAADFDIEKNLKTKALQEQIKQSESRSDSLHKLVERAKQQKANFKNQIVLYQNKQKDFVKALAEQARTLQSYFAKDFPYQKEKRLAEWEDLANALEKGNLTPEEGLNRLFTGLQSALDFAYDSEIYTGNYHATNSQTIEGSYIRLGSAFLGFISADEKLTAFLTHSKEGEYIWKDQDLALEIRPSLQNAIKVAEGKVAPELVKLPIQALELKEVTK